MIGITANEPPDVATKMAARRHVVMHGLPHDVTDGVWPSIDGGYHDRHGAPNPPPMHNEDVQLMLLASPDELELGCSAAPPAPKVHRMAPTHMSMPALGTAVDAQGVVKGHGRLVAPDSAELLNSVSQLPVVEAIAPSDYWESKVPSKKPG